MCGEEIELGRERIRIERQAELSHDAGFGVVRVRQRELLRIDDADALANEYAVAVFASVKRAGVGEVALHTRQLAEAGDLVDIVGAWNAVVDFLQCDDIRIGGTDDAGDAAEIEYAIVARTVVDVVREYAERGGAR